MLRGPRLPGGANNKAPHVGITNVRRLVRSEYKFRALPVNLTSNRFATIPTITVRLLLPHILRPVEVGLQVLPPHVFKRRAPLRVEEKLQSRRHTISSFVVERRLHEVHRHARHRPERRPQHGPESRPPELGVPRSRKGVEL